MFFTDSPYSYYFIDCDAFGEYFTNYDPGWRTGKSLDAGARVRRVRWVYDTFKVPVGSEGGSYLFAESLSRVEGITLPVIGFQDPEMSGDKSSIYYVGTYIDTNPVYLKEEKARLFGNPAYRLPLYEAVFHDSIVTTSHYSSPSLKFTNIREDLALMEILYQTAPMYHWDLDTLDKTREMIGDHVRVFHTTHSISSRYPITEFEYLTSDRLVQRAVFGSLEMTGNFSQTPHTSGDTTVPGKSILITMKETGESFVYQCSEKLKDPVQKYSIEELMHTLESKDAEK